MFGKGDSSLLTLLRDLPSGDVNPLVGRYLMDAVWQVEKKRGSEKTLESISANPDLWSHAASRYMEILAAEKPAALPKFIDVNSDKLAAKTESWGPVGYQLSNLNDPGCMVKSFEGWRKREDLMPWMLWNYSIVLRRRGDELPVA